VQIDKQTVRGAGARIRQVGDDASSYLQRVASPMRSRIQNTNGLMAIATLQQVVDQLQRRTTDLANDSRSTGDKVMVAADSYTTTDAARARSFASMSPSRSD